jgi:CHASE3 domain sensor protein
MPRSTTPRSATDPLIWLGLIAAILFFVATGAIAYLNFQTLKKDSTLLVHSEEALTALDDVLSTVKDAETGQRGYLLTGKDSYLGPYNAAIEQIAPGLAAVQRLTIDNPAQQDRLEPSSETRSLRDPGFRYVEGGRSSLRPRLGTPSWAAGRSEA